MPNPRLFLSHAGEDGAAARELATRLRAAGLEVWLDLEQPLLAADLGADDKALGEADAFAVYVGRSGIHTWVDREVRVALERSTADPDFRIFPILGPGADRKRLPAFLAQHAAIDLTAGRLEPEALQQLVREILESPRQRISLLAPEESPFRGLRAFGPEHAHLFFGRDREIEELIELLEEARFLAVVGTPGSGKSSLILAGLAPALCRGRSSPGSGRKGDWRIAAFRPGTDPFEALCKALPDLDPDLEPDERQTLQEPIAARLAAGADGLSQVATELVPRGSRALLVVDQFEEIFGTGIAAGARRRFIDSLLRAAAEAGERPIQVLIVLRADFFDRCLRPSPAARGDRRPPVPGATDGGGTASQSDRETGGGGGSYAGAGTGGRDSGRRGRRAGPSALARARPAGALGAAQRRRPDTPRLSPDRPPAGSSRVPRRRSLPSARVGGAPGGATYPHPPGAG